MGVSRTPLFGSGSVGLGKPILYPQAPIGHGERAPRCRFRVRRDPFSALMSFVVWRCLMKVLASSQTGIIPEWQRWLTVSDSMWLS